MGRGVLVDFKQILEQGLIDKHSDAGGHKVQQNRRDKRRSGKVAKGAAKRKVQVKGSVSRLLAQGSSSRKSGKTGQPAWMVAEQAEREVRRQLSRTSTRRLKPMIGDAAEALFRAGFKTLWDLTQAELDQVNVIPGFGPGARLSVRKYLDNSGVRVKW
jgi:hypothetical protein